MPRIDLLVGCPARKREWIIAQWVEACQIACQEAGLAPTFILLTDVQDEETRELCSKAVAAADSSWDSCHIVVDEEKVRQEEARSWTPSRISHMVNIRNRLLQSVRELKPAYFLSVDSDILLHPKAVVSLLETVEQCGADAAGGKCYLSPTNTMWPSYTNLPSPGSMYRPDTDQRIVVDAIMAIKLMTPAAYNVDYIWDGFGEDIGWSRVCRQRGLKLVWDGTVVSKHVWSPGHLGVVDLRCGY